MFVHAQIGNTSIRILLTSASSLIYYKSIMQSRSIALQSALVFPGLFDLKLLSTTFWAFLALNLNETKVLVDLRVSDYPVVFRFISDCSDLSAYLELLWLNVFFFCGVTHFKFWLQLQ